MREIPHKYTMDENNKFQQLLVGITNSIEDGAGLYDADDRLIQFNENYLQYFT
jgi:hypothetical protein